jgi:lipopolysaccharide/colanic/teichoic acid biosynthesis glycosyltransferase
VKRAFDLLVSLSLLAALSPLLLVLVFAVRASSPGPALFRQRRVGRHGRPFTILKFRTMRLAPASTGSAVTAGSDPRITPLGAWMRRTKLDELPQLLNVVRGEMSLVGPRPDVPEVVATYDERMRELLAVRPGITSIASVDLRHEEALLGAARDPERFYLEVVVPAKVEAAMQHVARPTIAFDLEVLGRTAAALFRGSDRGGCLTRQLAARLERWNREVNSERSNREPNPHRPSEGGSS